MFNDKPWIQFLVSLKMNAVQPLRSEHFSTPSKDREINWANNQQLVAVKTSFSIVVLLKNHKLKAITILIQVAPFLWDVDIINMYYQSPSGHSLVARW